MAVPGSGSLCMLGLAREKVYDEYTSSQCVLGPMTMYDLVNGGNACGSTVSFDVTNTSSLNYPSDIEPYAFSDWYAYDHDSSGTPPPGFYLVFERDYPELYTSPTYIDNPDPQIGDSDSKWRRGNFNLIPFRGEEIRILVRFLHGTTSFRCDFCINSFFYNTDTEARIFPENNPLQFLTSSGYPSQRNSANQPSPELLDLYGTWVDIPLTGNNTNGEFGVEIDETVSSNTGPNLSYIFGGGIFDDFNNPFTSDHYKYWYYESSGQTVAGTYNWMRTSEFTVPTNVDDMYFIYSAYSNDITTWEDSNFQVWVQVVAGL